MHDYTYYLEEDNHLVLSIWYYRYINMGATRTYFKHSTVFL